MPPTPGNLIGQSPNGIVSVQIGAGLALSAGTLSVSGGGTGGTPAIVGGGIVSVSSRSNSFTISATGGGASGNFAYQSAFGNTTGATSSQTRLLTLESIRFAGGVSGGFSAGSLVVSGVTTVSSGTLQNRFALGNTTSATSSFAGTLSILSVSGMGAASAGFDTNGVLIISAATGTTAASATSMNLTATGNTTGSSSATTRVITAETLSFAGGVSGGFSGNTIIISGATTAAQTAPTLSIYAVGNTTTSVSSGVIAAGSLSFDGAGAVSVGISGSSVVISAPAAVASASTMNVTALGNTTGSSSATTRLITAESISFTGGVSGGWSGNTLVISGAASQAASATSMNMTALGNTTGSSSATTKVLTEMSISGMGDISAGFSGGTIVISGTAPVASATSMGLSAIGNTTGSTSSMTQALTAESISFAGGVSGGFSGGTLVISGGTGTQVGGIGTISHYSNSPPIISTRSAFCAFGTMHCVPIIPPSVVTFNHIGVLQSGVFTAGCPMTVSTSLAASFTATASRVEQGTWAIGIWTNSSLDVTFTLQGSTSVMQNVSQFVSVSQTAGSVTVSQTMTVQYGGLGGTTTQDTYSETRSQAGNWVGSIGSIGPPGGYNGPLYFIYPWVSSLNTGVNIVGIGLLSAASGTTTGTSRMSITATTIWAMGLSLGVTPNGALIVSNAAGNPIRFYDILTSSAGSVMPVSIVLSASQGTSGAPFFHFNSW